MQLALHGCAPATELAGVRAENETVRVAVAAAEAEGLRVCKAFEELRDENAAQAAAIGEQFRETKAYVGSVSAEAVRREQAAELVAR